MDELKEGGGGSVHAHAEFTVKASEHVAVGSETLGDSRPDDPSSERGGSTYVDGVCSNGGDGEVPKSGGDVSGGPVPDTDVRSSEGERDIKDVSASLELEDKPVDASSERDEKTVSCDGVNDTEKPEAKVKNSEVWGRDDVAVVGEKEIVKTDTGKTLVLEVEKVDVMTAEDAKEKELGEKIEESKEMAFDGGNMVQETNGEKLGVLHDSEGNSGFEMIDASSSAVSGCSNVDTQVMKQKNNAIEASSNLSRSDVSTVETACNEREEGSAVDRDQEQVNKNDVSAVETACSETIEGSAVDTDQQEQVSKNDISTVETACNETVEGSAVDRVQKEQLGVVNEGGDFNKHMESASVDRDSGVHTEEQLKVVDSIGEGTENYEKEPRDENALCEDIKEVALEATEIDENEFHILQEAQEMKPEEYSETSTTRHADPTDDKEIEICNQEAAKGEIEVADRNILLDPNFDIANCIDFSGFLPCSGTDGHVSTEMVAPEVAGVDTQETLSPNTEVQGPTGIDQEPNSVCLVKSESIAPDASQSDPNTIDEMDVENTEMVAPEVAGVDTHETLTLNTEVQGPTGVGQEPNLVCLDKSKSADHDASQSDPNTIDEMDVENAEMVAPEVAGVDTHETLTPNTEVQGSTGVDQELNLMKCLDKSESGAPDAPQSDPNTTDEMDVDNAEIVAPEVAGVDSQETLTLNTEVQGPAIVQELSLKKCLDKSERGAPDALTSPNTNNEMDVEKQVTDAENVSLHPEENQEVKEQLGQSHGIAGSESLLVDSDVPEEVSHCGSDQNLRAEGDLEDIAPETSDQSPARDTPHIDQNIGQDMKVEEVTADAVQPELPEGGGSKVENQIIADTSEVLHASYQLPLKDQDKFSVSDLVWGKVRSHPWWPGQIFDPSDASEEATKHNKENRFLVAYFGDGTFAWNDTFQLKTFMSNFSELEKQNSTESFTNAVNCALEEILRRVELGLACSCLPKDVYDNIRFQTVHNSGIRKESSRIDDLGKCVPASSLEPNQLLEYIKALARSPSCGAARLDLEIAKVQLLTFYRLKGYYKLPEFHTCGKSLEDDVNNSISDGIGSQETADKANGQIFLGQEAMETENRVRSYNKRKHNLKDGHYGSKKQRSLSELMDEPLDSPDSEVLSDGKVDQKKRKTDDDDSSHEGRKTVPVAKVSSTPPLPKASFKIGECIRRAASQLAGSPKILKSNNAGDVSDVNSDDVQRKDLMMPPECSSSEDLLSQLHSAARDPLEGRSSLNFVSGFFSDFRNSVVPGHTPPGVKRSRSPNSVAGHSEAFEFEEMNDTYWTDRMIDNGEEEQASVKRGYQIVPVELKPVQRTRRPYTRRKYSDTNPILSEKPAGNVDENAPAELMMNFSDMDNLPSEMKLNKMFRHFGPIRESLTEVDRDTCRARVVFKKCSDAEVAANSAGKFNIFGPIVVNYELNYTITEQFKVAPYFVSLGEEDASLCLTS